jgi:hypothetical protein
MRQHWYRFIPFGILFVLLSVLSAPMVTDAQTDVFSPSEFQDEMRRLWEDHIVWTRLYIISAVDELPDIDLVTQRLLDNQDDIGDAIKPFYGDEAGNQLSALLRDHILVAADLIAAAKAGDNDAMGVASEAWDTNANDIGAFLHAANVEHWPQATLAHEMHMHLELTLQEAQARLAGEYAADIAAYDEIHQHILHMADILSSGIVAQFPDRFAP